MKPFKHYKNHRDIVMDEIKENLTNAPFFFTWIPDSDINSEYELVARRKIICDNIDVSYMIKEEEFTISVDNSARAVLPIVHVTIPHFIWGDDSKKDDGMDTWLDLENNNIFIVDDITFRANEYRSKLFNKLVMLNFMSYNFYIEQTGSTPEKAIKTIEFVKQYAERNEPDFWLSSDEVLLARIKIKYLKSEDLTDDDYALNAMLGL